MIFANCMTLIGERHKEKGLPCQDSSGIFYGNGFAVAVVADGHSSVPHIRSDVGSQFAVEISINCVKDIIKKYESKIATILNKSGNDFVKDLKESIVKTWVKQIKDHYLQNELTSYEEKLISSVKYDLDVKKLYGTTLIVVVKGKNYSFGLQVGDGQVISIEQDGSINFDCNDVDNLCENNVTTSLSDVDATLRSFYCTGSKVPKAFFLYTDGFEKSFNTKDLTRHIFGIISLSHNKNMWYKSVASQIDICTKRSKDDTSIAMLYDESLNLSELYVKTFSLRSPNLIDYDVPYRSKICMGGHISNGDLIEKIKWLYRGEMYCGEQVNGCPKFITKCGKTYHCKGLCYELTGYFVVEENGVKIYEGYFLKGNRNGKGVEYYRDISPPVKMIECSFKNNMPINKVKKYYKSGNLEYKGYLENNVYHGKGIVYWDSENFVKRFEGMFLNGQLNEFGSEYDKNGNLIYEGSFKDGKYDGVGKYKNGNLIYEGSFKDGKYDGVGKYKNGNLIYEGSFKDGKYDGVGKLYENSILIYEGSFKDGEYDGVGKLYENSILIYEGHFKKGIRDGKGTLYKYVDGSMQCVSGIFDGKYTKGWAYMINSDRPSIYIGDSFYGKYDGFGILFECDTKCRCHMVSGLFKKGAIHNVKEDCHINHTDIPAVIERWISYIIRYIEKDSVKIEYLKKLSIDLIEKINK